jgi:hypothetical protein
MVISSDLKSKHDDFSATMVILDGLTSKVVH